MLPCPYCDLPLDATATPYGLHAACAAALNDELDAAFPEDGSRWKPNEQKNTDKPSKTSMNDRCDLCGMPTSERYHRLCRYCHLARQEQF